MCAVAAVILFAPLAWWQRLGVHEPWTGYRFCVAVVFGFSIVYLLTYPVGWCFLSAVSFAKRKVQSRRTVRQSVSKLKNLSLDEEDILRRFVLERRRTMKFLPGNGTVALLVHARVLVQTSTVGDLIEGFPFSLTDWAWDYLLKHPECVGIPKQDLGRTPRS